MQTDRRSPGVDFESIWQASERFSRQSDRRFGRLRDQVRRRLIRDAIRYTSVYREVPPAARAIADNRPLPPIVLAGHQPTLFHPGVWFKNFALDRIARQHNALAINLVVDNDVASGVSVRVPQENFETGQMRSVPVAYDVAGGGVPFEQTAIADRDFFESFATRLSAAAIGLVDQPSVNQLWPHAVAAVNRCDIAACAIAQARHGLESSMGLQTLELPIGVVARDVGFARFTLELLDDLPRFLEIYNRWTDHYRREHGIRSSAHPVPNLQVDGDWMECPLWVYGDDAPSRRGVWVRRDGDRLELSDRAGCSMTLDSSDLDAAAEVWTDQLSNDFKVRPRALLTTMYARWILGDLFLHGIGGGKYDQLGDKIAGEFFGVDPPPYLVISATVQLPGLEPTDHAGRIRTLRRAQRDCRYQPERIDHSWSDDHRRLIDRKRELLAAIAPQQDRAVWHRELDEINRTLFDALADRRAEIASRLRSEHLTAASDRLLASREHSFCLYPLDYLRDSFATMLDQAFGPPVGQTEAV